MRFSSLVERFRAQGVDAWVTHYEAAQARERGADVILLSVGDPDLQTPPAVVARAIASLHAGDTHYAPARGRHALRAAIAALHTQRSGQHVTPDNIVYLSGAQNALFAASLCLAGPGDEVLTFEPLYATYPATLEVSGARLVRVPCDERFRPDLRALESLITARSRALFWATPNNPSGVILNDAELERIAELAIRHDLWLVADEVYAGLAPGGRVPGLADRLPERTVTLGSLSKSHAMTGWRAGWLVAPEALAAHVESLAMCMLFGMPGFIQEAATTALGLAEESQEHIRSLCRARCTRLAAGLADIANLRVVVPEAGMFLLVDIRATGLSAFDFMRALYDSEGVSVMDGAAFGPFTAGFIRIFFAIEEALLDEACVRMRRFCARQGTGKAHRA